MSLLWVFGPPNIEILKARRDVEGLIRALGYQKDPAIRWNAADALGKIGEARAVEPLIGALWDPDVTLKQHAADALGRLGDGRAVEPLLTMLGKQDGLIRLVAARALGELGDARAIQPLRAALADPDDWVRATAAEALVQFGDAPAAAALLLLFQHKNLQLREVASRALASIKAGTPAVEPLLTALRDSDGRVRTGAAQALGRIGDVRAVEPLVTATLADTDYHCASLQLLSLEGLLDRVRGDIADGLLQTMADLEPAREMRVEFGCGVEELRRLDFWRVKQAARQELARRTEVG